MEYDASDLGPCKKRVEVTLGAEEIDREFDKSYAQLRTQMTIPGFRPGKAPRRVLERKFGDHVKSEVTQELLQSNIEEVLSKLELKVVSPPTLVDEDIAKDGVTPGKELVFSFEVETKPEFDLPEYKGREAHREVPEVTDEHIDRILEGQARERATWQPAATDTYEIGDQICASLTVLDGERLIYEEEELQLPPQATTAAGFTLGDLAQIFEHAKVGATVETEAQAPPDFTFDGKSYTADDKLSASLELLELKRRIEPEIDEEFARELGHDDMESARKDIREKLGVQAEQAADEGVVRQILDTLVEEAQIPIAEGPTERMLERRIQNAAIEMLMAGVKEEELTARIDEERQRLREAIEEETRRWLLVEKIADKEKIFTLEDDVDQKIQEIARANDTTPVRVREHYEEKDMLPELRSGILEQKVCTFLLKKAKITEKDEGDESTGDAGKEEAGNQD